MERKQMMSKEPYAADHNMIKATAGWMQCSDILETVTESFEFAMAELRANKFEWGDAQKIAFIKAESRLRAAKMYLDAVNKARTDLEN